MNLIVNSATVFNIVCDIPGFFYYADDIDVRHAVLSMMLNFEHLHPV